MWLLILAQGSLACTPAATVTGFDDWVDGAVDVPTDARIVTLADMRFDVTLTRLDTGETVGAMADTQALDTVLGEALSVHTPAEELAPATTYRADVADYEGTPYTATFTTGAGPTAGGFAAPVLTNVQHSAWEDADGAFECSLGNPALVRTVGGTIDVPDGLPVGSYVAIRTDAKITAFEYVTEATDHDFDLTQGEREDSADAKFAAHDCLTPVLILPSGAEVAGDTTCIEEAKGLGGCATGGLAGSWVLVAAAVLALGATRRGV